MMMVQESAETLLVRQPGYPPAIRGGNHHWVNGWQGTNIQNVTSNTVAVFRQANDELSPGPHPHHETQPQDLSAARDARL